MRKTTIAILMALCLFAFSACGAADTSGSAISDNTTANETPSSAAGETNTAESDSEQQSSSGKALVAYFAYSENMGDVSNLEVDAISSASLNANTDNSEGNLQIMAQEIVSQTNADVFHILVSEPYAVDYDTMLPRAIDEMQNEEWPALQSKIDNLSDYDVIYLGTPVWNGTIPPALHTFLAENDLSDKKVVLFGIHLGSGLGRMESALQELAPGMELVDGYRW